MARRWTRVLLWTLAGIVLLAGLAALYIQQKGLVQRVYVYQDGSSLLRLSASSALRNVSWSAPREIPDGNAAPNPPPESPHWSSPALLVNAVRGAGGDFDIHVRELESTGWSASLPLPGGVNTPSDEISPSLSPDGSILFFASNRPGGLGGFDLYLSRRARGGWEKPQSLGSRVNSPYDEKGPALHPSSSILVFATNRPRGFLLAPPAEWADVPLASWKAGNESLAYVARAVKPGEVGKWSEVLPVEARSASADDREPCFSPSGDFLYFASNRDGGAGGFDIYRAHVRVEGDPSAAIPELVLEAPQDVGVPVCSRRDELDPRIFLDGHALVYRVAEPQGGVESLFESRTREVESELELAAVPLRALAANAIRITILILGGVLLVLATVVLFRHRELWSTSLVLRCSVIAVMTHAAMLYGFYFWVVSDEIVALAEKKTPFEEVTVERALQAKLADETMRMEVASLAREAAAQAVARQSERAAESPREAVEAPNAVSMPATETPSKPVESTAASPEERVVKDAALAFDAAKTSPEPSPSKESLERPEPSQPEKDAVELSAHGGQSLKAALETPKPGPISPLESVAAPAERAGEVELTAAATQVRAPVENTSSLPPVARHTAEAPAIVTPLAVPAQSQDVSEVRTLAAPALSVRPTLGAASAPSDAPTPPSVHATELVTAESPWRAQASGILPSPSSHSEARDLPQTSVAPSPVLSPRQTSGAALKLEEAAPVAEVASSAKESAADPQPRPSERAASFGAPNRGKLTAEVASVVSRPEARPLTAQSSAVEAPSQASLARLDAVPTPGVLSEAQLPRLERSSSRSEAAVLPEGENGAKRAAGAPLVADILTPRRAARREWQAGLPSAESPRLEPVEVRSRPAATLPPRGTTVDRPRLGESSKPLDMDIAKPELPEEASATTRTVAQKLPEAPPELRGEKDLRKVRSREGREVLVSQMGGTRESEDAVRLGLDWLARHQSLDGRWDVDGFDSECQQCRSPGVQVDCDAAVTALALLCFLGQNHTPSNPESPFRKQAQAAITWLLKNQGPDGSLGGADQRYTMYTHGIATLALSEALILTKDKQLEEPVRRAVGLILAAQNKTTGGWRYKPQPPLRGDTSITGWQVLALVSARGAGIQVPEAAFDRARHWLDNEVAGGQHGGIFGYTKPEEPRVAMTAEGMFARLLLGANRTDRNIEEAARYIHTETRGGGYLDNLYLLYYGNLALYHYQGWIWERWNTEVREFLVRAQQKTGTLAGSWDPAGPYTETGGRVLSTCFATLTLEVYYRYLPLYWTLDKSAK